MFFGFPYVECSRCGRLVDEWSYNPETKVFLCLDCEDEELEKRKELYAVPTTNRH